MINRFWFLGCLWLLALSANAQVRIEVVRYPKLLIADGPIYLATNLNNWNPGSPEYRLTKAPNGTYFIDLPNVPELFYYKFTQGNWTMVEGDRQGNIRENRTYDRQSEPNPRLVQTVIDGWEKRIGYALIIRKIPENTPDDASIYVTGNFNNWNPADPLHKLKRWNDGSWRTTIFAEQERIEYKFTRGSWNSVEGRETGKARPNRVFFRTSDVNTKGVEHEIAGWEDLTGAFHFFSLYDLLLLFSVFQGLLLIVAIPTIQNYNRQANRWLVASIGLSSVVLFFHILSSYREIAQAFTKVQLLPDFVLFLYGPLFYFYLKRLLFNAPVLTARWQLHFIPTVLLFFGYLPYFLMNQSTFEYKVINQDWDLQAVYLVVGLVAWCWNVYYWNLFRRTIRSYQTQYETTYSSEQNLNYLNTVVLIQAVCLSLWAFFFVVLLIGRFFSLDILPITERLIDSIWLVFSTITYFVGYYAIHQPETFKVAPQTLSIFDDVLEAPVPSPPPAPTKIPDEPDENLPRLKEKVEVYVQKHKPYTNPQLTLNELATKLKMPSHTLSRVINDGFDKNFFDFINSYRIEEFKRRAEDPNYKHFTLLGIAYEVGFNSKSAFNRSFKKITNQTPREYFQLAQEPVE